MVAYGFSEAGMSKPIKLYAKVMMFFSHHLMPIIIPFCKLEIP